MTSLDDPGQQSPVLGLRENWRQFYGALTAVSGVGFALRFQEKRLASPGRAPVAVLR